MGFDIKLKRFIHVIVLFALLGVFQSCIPRCTKFPAYARCQVRMRHTHSGKEFRGMPFWKKQNLQYGEKHKGEKNSPYVTPKNSKKFLGPTKKKVVVKSRKSRPKGKK